jgi:hypothetical protein
MHEKTITRNEQEQAHKEVQTLRTESIAIPGQQVVLE